jgi:hypothetical protein
MYIALSLVYKRKVITLAAGDTDTRRKARDRG